MFLNSENVSFSISICRVRIQTWTSFERPISGESINKESFWNMAANCNVDWKLASLLLFSPPLMILSGLVSSADDDSWQSLRSHALYRAPQSDWLLHVDHFSNTKSLKKPQRQLPLIQDVIATFNFGMAFGRYERRTKLWSADGEMGKCQTLQSLYVTVVLAQ